MLKNEKIWRTCTYNTYEKLYRKNVIAVVEVFRWEYVIHDVSLGGWCLLHYEKAGKSPGGPTTLK